LRNYLKRENGNIKEDGTEIDRHHTSWWRRGSGSSEKLMESCPIPLESDLGLASNHRIGTLL